MTTEKAKQVESHFHKTYKSFDSFYEEKKGAFGRLIENLFRRSMRLRFEKVIQSAAPYEDKSVLDVGCGAGRYSLALATHGIQNALGIDFAQNMIDQANRHAKELNVDSVCRFVKDDFISMNINESFDHVFAMGVLDYIAEPVAFVQKMINCASKSVMISFPSKGGLMQWLRKLVFKYIKKCPVYFYSQSEVAHIASLAGAQDFKIEKLAKDYFLFIFI